MQKTTIVLAMHGTPPKDFPQPEVIELFSLHARIEQASPNLPASQVKQWQQRYHELDEKVRHWPRDAVLGGGEDLAGTSLPARHRDRIRGRERRRLPGVQPSRLRRAREAGRRRDHGVGEDARGGADARLAGRRRAGFDCRRAASPAQVRSSRAV